jgi:hypothetical protein
MGVIVERNVIDGNQWCRIRCKEELLLARALTVFILDPCEEAE